MRKIRTKDLRNLTFLEGPKEFLRCPVCGYTCSANAGDYFMSDPESVFLCPCGEPLEMVISHTEFIRINPDTFKPFKEGE